jgi:hypothetical protein
VPFIATGRQGGLAGAHGFPVLQEDAHFIQCETEREDVRCGVPIVVDQQLRSHVPDEKGRRKKKEERRKKKERRRKKKEERRKKKCRIEYLK